MTDSNTALYENRYPLRLAVVDETGFPRIVSLWFQYVDGELYCATHKDAWVVKQLMRSGNIGFEIASNEPPYHGVRGTGVASIYPMGDQPLLEQLVERYLGNTESDFARWLLARQASEFIIQIKPIKESFWDYSDRMATASGL